MKGVLEDAKMIEKNDWDIANMIRSQNEHGLFRSDLITCQIPH